MNDDTKVSLGLDVDWKIMKQSDHPAAHLHWGSQDGSRIVHGWIRPGETWHSLCGWNARYQQDGSLRTRFLAYDEQPCQPCRDRYQFLLNQWLEQHEQWGE